MGGIVNYRKIFGISTVALVVSLFGLSFTRTFAHDHDDDDGNPSAFDRSIAKHSEAMLESGRQIFRFDTFGDEDFWGGTLQLHQAIEGAKLGGVGPGVSPRIALAVGLKVDVDALPDNLVKALRNGTGQSG